MKMHMSGFTRKEGSTDSNWRRRSKKESIYDTYVIASSKFIDSERALPIFLSTYILIFYVNDIIAFCILISISIHTTS